MRPVCYAMKATAAAWVMVILACGATTPGGGVWIQYCDACAAATCDSCKRNISFKAPKLFWRPAVGLGRTGHGRVEGDADRERVAPSNWFCCVATARGKGHGQIELPDGGPAMQRQCTLEARVLRSPAARLRRVRRVSPRRCSGGSRPSM